MEYRRNNARHVKPPHATCPPIAPLPELATPVLAPPSGRSMCGILFLIKWKLLSCLARCTRRHGTQEALGTVTWGKYVELVAC